MVDVNQAWSEQQLHELTPRLAQLGVLLIEQSMPVDADDALHGFNSPNRCVQMNPVRPSNLLQP